MGLVRVKESFSTGRRNMVLEGTILDAADPVLKGRTHLTEPVETAATSTVEQATANPGERRTVKRTAKKTAAKDGAGDVDN